METDKERLLLCYQVNQQVVHGKFPLNRELAFELASLMAQVLRFTVLCVFYVSRYTNRTINSRSTLENTTTTKRAVAAPEAIRIISYSKLWINFIRYAIGPTSPPINWGTTIIRRYIENILHIYLNIVCAFLSLPCNISFFSIRDLQEKLQEKWIALKGRSVLDCVRIYLTCTRKWPFFGATLYQAKVRWN